MGPDSMVGVKKLLEKLELLVKVDFPKNVVSFPGILGLSGYSHVFFSPPCSKVISFPLLSYSQFSFLVRSCVRTKCWSCSLAIKTIYSCVCHMKGPKMLDTLVQRTANQSLLSWGKPPPLNQKQQKLEQLESSLDLLKQNSETALKERISENETLMEKISEGKMSWPSVWQG